MATLYQEMNHAINIGNMAMGTPGARQLRGRHGLEETLKRLLEKP